jgi:protein-disulfide isomerase
MFNRDKDSKEAGILDAPPRTTFFLGLFVGIAATAIISILVIVPLMNNDNNSGSPTGGTAADSGSAAGDSAVTPPAPAAGAPTAVSIATPSSDSDYYRGEKPEDAEVVLVEYSDYECPFCQRLHPTMIQLMDEYDGKISWVLRNFPLTSIHPEAQPAAEAAECVGKLAGNDAFWEFGDALFENQATLGTALYTDLAGEAGVSESKFADCLEAGDSKDRIQSDATEGASAGVTGTPATFILPNNDTSQGQLISGALPAASFQQVIDAL